MGYEVESRGVTGGIESGSGANPDSKRKRKVNRVIVSVMNAHKIMKPRKYTALAREKNISRVIRATAP